MWDFQQIQAYASEYQQDRFPGCELAFVFSEWTPVEGLGLMDAYPAAFEDIPPTEELPAGALARLWVDLGAGWQQIATLPTVQRVGVGTAGVLQSGVATSIVIQGWNAKQIAVGYVIAPPATLQAINADRTVGLAVIRHPLDPEQEAPLSADEPFTAAQVNALATWLNDHGVTNTEFADLFDTTPTQIADFLTTHPRWQLAQVMHDRFS